MRGPYDWAVASSTLDETTWRDRAARHAERVDAWTAGHRARSAAGEAHPVEDFLFTYYSLRPSQLRRWHPGADVVLLGGAAAERLRWRWYQEVRTSEGDTGVAIDLDAYVEQRGAAAQRTLRLLRATAERAPRLGCFGLHEWAMVYRADRRRHERWPLRLGQAGTDRVVEQGPLRCTHYDAFRFFTPDARPRNDRVLAREDQVAREQPGCLHATMDLYKWAYKLGPVVPSELTADCFALAREVRELDMRASPYDLSDLGLTPVPVELPSGRAEYVALQRAFTERGQALRARLIAVCDGVLRGVGAPLR